MKDADSVKDLGKMSAVLEDYSPFQIGTSGRFGKRSFTIIGRIQLSYEAGRWNEWYCMFDDGETGWLGDSSGLYTFTLERDVPQERMPAFSALQVGRAMKFEGNSYIAAEIRRGSCIGGQGELPFKVGAGYEIEVADFRFGKNFLTLDYSDDKVRAYTGQAVKLEDLQCQLLRDDDTIKESAAKFKGKVKSLDCPSCGGSITYAPGLSKHLHCSSCHAQIDASSPKAQVVKAAEEVDAVYTTLQLGMTAKIAGVEHRIIGLMMRVDDEGTPWTEYLLYNTRGLFLWLIETNTGWARASVQDNWPQWDLGDNAVLGNQEFSKLYDYQASVTYALGAFNWRVNVGDQVKVTEFECGQAKLAAESTTQELTWSLSTPVKPEQIREWFGQDVAADKADDDGKISAKKFIWWLLIINAIPALGGGILVWFLILIGILMLWLPSWYLNNQVGGDGA
ncbi:DUF4178 domain-containing protein [Massilia sp. W12]|uniref:DUF4178 domain-containing protein n=1 Tax=Massilia sp. W12 TaxID=3126507 RepID=UPI0030D5D762